MFNNTQSNLIHQIIGIARRHKITIVVFPLVSIALGTLYFLCCPRTYQSQARLFLRIGRETIGIDPTATTGQTLPSYTADRTDEVKSAQEIFKSRSVASKVVDRLGPDVVLGRGPGSSGSRRNALADLVGKPIGAIVDLIKSVDPISPREEAILHLEGNLHVDGERQSTVILVDYRAKSPQLAQTICEAVVDVAQQEHTRAHRSEESSPFFMEQQKRLREQLDRSLEALRDAKNEMGLANVEQRRKTLEAQFSAIGLDRLKSNQQLAQAEASIDDYQRQLADIPERAIDSKKIMPNLGADILRDRLFALQVESMDLKARYNDTHPLVGAVNEQLREAEKILEGQAEERTETVDAINIVHRELSLAMKKEESAAAGLRSRVAELDKEKESVLASLRTLNQHDLKIDQLTLEADLARGKFMQYARTMEEARIDKALQADGVSSISVVQPATIAEKPLNPSRSLTVAGIFVLATGGTLGLVSLGERNHPPAPPVDEVRGGERRMTRRRIRRQFASKSNGQSEKGEMTVSST